MGYNLEMYEFYDELEHRKLNKPFILFKEKGLISCRGVSFREIVWNYLCWVLAGKPEIKEWEIR